MSCDNAKKARSFTERFQKQRVEVFAVRDTRAVPRSRRQLAERRTPKPTQSASHALDIGVSSLSLGNPLYMPGPTRKVSYLSKRIQPKCSLAWPVAASGHLAGPHMRVWDAGTGTHALAFRFPPLSSFLTFDPLVSAQHRRRCLSLQSPTMSTLRLNHGKTAAVELTDTQGTPSPNGAEKFDDTGNPVAEKYRGTDADRHDMAVMGNRQVLRVGNPPLTSQRSRN